MSAWLSIGTAAALGATSGVHCAAMCGPLVVVGASREGKLDRGKLGAYLGGRAIGYAVLGAIAGALGAPLAGGRAGAAVRLGLSLLVAAMLLYRAIVLIKPAAGERLVKLRRGPSGSGIFDRIARFVPRRGFGLGLATAVFPCGALFAAVIAAASSGSWDVGAAMMVTFSAASAPLLILPAIAAAKVGAGLRGATAKRIAAVALVAAAAWVVTPALRGMLVPERPACCEGVASAPASQLP